MVAGALSAAPRAARPLLGIAGRAPGPGRIRDSSRRLLPGRLPAFQSRLNQLLDAGATGSRKGDHFGLAPDVATAICTAAEGAALRLVRPGDWRWATFGA